MDGFPVLLLNYGQAATSSGCVCSSETSAVGCVFSASAASSGLVCMFLCQQGGFAFLDTFMAFLIHLIISTFTSASVSGMCLRAKSSKRVAAALLPYAPLKLSSRNPPADNGFLFGREVGDDVHFLRPQGVGRLFLPDTEYPEVFPAERRQQEEIYHLFLVLREFAFQTYQRPKSVLSVCNGFLTAICYVCPAVPLFHRESFFGQPCPHYGGSTLPYNTA